MFSCYRPESSGRMWIHMEKGVESIPSEGPTCHPKHSALDAAAVNFWDQPHFYAYDATIPPLKFSRVINAEVRQPKI
jgi:hypothetical protein